MIQEFALKPTPALARRLVTLSKVAAIALDERIEALAQADLLDLATIEDLGLRQHAPRHMAVIQQLVDFEMRAVLATDDDATSRVAICAAALAANAFPMVVLTTARKAWSGLAAQMGKTVTTNPQQEADILLVGGQYLTTKEIIDRRRGGLLVIEESYIHSMHANDSMLMDLSQLSGTCREFPRAIILANIRGSLRTGWSVPTEEAIANAVLVLFERAPVGLIRRSHLQLKGVLSGLRQRGYRINRACDLYPMFNVVVNVDPGHFQQAPLRASAE